MKKYQLNIKGKLFNLDKPKIMAILNMTPDSFYDGGKHKPENIIETVNKMLEDGADIIDIGGYSTKPNAIQIDILEEKQRIVPILELLRNEFKDLIISIDTFRPEIAKICLDLGADIINDVLGGANDEAMFKVVSSYKAPYILMHNYATDERMHVSSENKFDINQIIKSLENKIQKLNSLGLCDIIIDPGIGFSKSLDDNYEIIKKLDYISCLNSPILIGISRKSMIYKLLEIGPEQSLTGTIALNMVALQKGAHILRVHDVKAAKETIKIFEKTGS